MNTSHDLQEERAQLLKKIDFFSGLERTELAKLAGSLEPISLHSGEILFRQGEPGDAFYILSRGCLSVYVSNEDTGEVLIKKLYPGDPIGEMSLLTQEQRSATIKAEEDGEVLRLDRSHFLSLIEKSPAIAISIAGTISRRLSSLLSRVSSKVFLVQGISEKSENKSESLQEVINEPKSQSWFFPKILLCILAIFLVLFFGRIIPVPAGLTLSGWQVLLSFLVFLIILPFNVMPVSILALILAVFWAAWEVIPVKVVFSGFTSPNWILVLTIMMIGNIIASSGLLYRFTLWIVSKSNGSYSFSVAFFMLAGIFLSPVIPSTNSRLIFIADLVKDYLDTLGYAPKSKAAAGISMAAFTGFGQMNAVFLTSSNIAILIYSILPAKNKLMINWFTWLGFGIVLNLVLLIGLFGAILVLYPAEKKTGDQSAKIREKLSLQKIILGPMSKDEFICFISGICLLIGFMALPFHGIHPAWVTTLVLSVLYIFHVAKEDLLQTINWNFAIFFGILIGFEQISTVVHLDTWLPKFIEDLMSSINFGVLPFLMIYIILCFLVNFIVPWQACAPILLIIMMPLALKAGINPFIIGFISLVACNNFILPYQSNQYICYTEYLREEIYTHKQIRPFAITYSLVTLLGILVSLPFWYALGLI